MGEVPSLVGWLSGVRTQTGDLSENSGAWVRPPRLGVGLRAMPRLCIELFPGIYLQLRKITVKPQSGQPKSAWEITAEHDSFGRLGHRLAVALTGLLAPVALGLHFESRGQPSARVNICRVAELRGSPRQLNLSRNSQLGL